MKSSASLFVLVLFVCLISGASAFNVTLNEEGPVSRILYNMELELPDFSFRYLGLKADISNVTCFHLTAEGLEGRLVGVSEILNPNTSAILFMNITAYDMTLNCTANWTYGGDSGDMIMTLGNGTELALRISVSENMTASVPVSPSASPSPSPSISISSSNTPTSSNSTTPSVTPTSNSSPSQPLKSASSTNTTVSTSPIPTSASTTPSVNISASSSVVASASTTPSANISASSPIVASASTTPSANISASSSPVVASASTTPSANISASSSPIVFADILARHVSEFVGDEITAKLEKHYAKMVEEDDTTGTPPIPPQFIFNNVNCSFYGDITYLHTSSFLLNEFADDIIKEVDELMPDMVCSKMDEIVSETIADFANGFIATLYNATYTLNSNEPKEIFNEEGFFYAFLGATILFLCMMFFLLIIPTIISLYNEHQRAKYGEEQPLIDDFASHTSVILPKPSDQALIMDRRLAWYWRYALLLTVLYNVALFASSTVSVASSVYVYLSAGSNIYRLPSLYSFMIVSSVIEMWEAGVWPLSLLIGITSGIWPYVKLICMFFCLITPPRFLSKKWRKRVLRVLDALGKWSLIDVYVLVLFIEAFRVHIPLGENVAFDMAVTPEYAFFAYLLATVISLSLTHVMLFVHDELEEPAVPENGRMELLMNHKFHYGSQKFIATIGGKILVPALCTLAAAGVIAGSFVYAFELNWEGSLVGELLYLTGQPQSQDYSVVSLLKDIPSTSFDSPSGAGIRTIQVAYAMFVMVFPLLHLTSLLIVWITPLTMQMQRAAFILIEIFSAWAAMDVFIVALIVALLELQQFAEFIIGPKCNGIDELLGMLFPDGSATCFTVKATLKEGSWILVAAVIVLLVVGYSVMYICNKAIHERKDKEISHLQKTGSMSDFYEPDRSVSIVTKGIVGTFKLLFLVRFL